ncbi:hypothetical protein AQUSIP_12350 [Aquicella siphonis]|uniref:Calpain catalytic domain-containing protein n=1 Tax=Aquicella siphonis TaxID=254247 RepID=A0A5E4PGE4_9COXI|nr:C2 family cysteine protease [Aquicella siphonis]VVC75934.1 hypothetical protein AQUSIP_12350 [Aquicella siphonis]
MMRGTLMPPRADEIQQIEDNEFGRIYKVKQSSQPVYLFAKPPHKRLRSTLRGFSRNRYKRLPIGKDPYPAILTDPSDEAMIGVHQELAPDQVVIARNMPGHDGILEVVTFKHKGKRRDDMPESGDSIEIISKGYAFKKDLLRNEDIEEHFEPVTDVLFPHDDLIGDVKQSIFGDCFLLSSIIGILKTPGGSDFIKNMMRQSADGKHTIVRLFDPNTREPVYYHIKNSYYYQNGSNTVKHLAPWVHILEKAYTAHALKRNPNEKDAHAYVYTYPSFREIFGDGGRPETALIILTGQDAQELQMPEPSDYPWNQDSLLYSMAVYNRVAAYVESMNQDQIPLLDTILRTCSQSSGLLPFVKQIQTLTADITNHDIQTIRSTVGALLKEQIQYDEQSVLLAMLSRMLDSEIDDEAKLEQLHAFSHYLAEYIKLIIESPLAINKAVKDISVIAELGKYIKELILHDRWDDFEHGINLNTATSTLEDVAISLNKLMRYQPPLPAKVLECFSSYMGRDADARKIRWNGALGTGFYTEKSLGIYKTIKHKLHGAGTSYSLAASTHASFPEGEVPGLRSQHAYGIIGVEKKTVQGRELRFVKLRNPWGRVGRHYDWENRSYADARSENFVTEQPELAEFEVELSDFTRYFCKVSYGKCQPVPQAAPLLQAQVSDPDLLSQGKQPKPPRPPQHHDNEDAGYAVKRPGFFKRHLGKFAGAGMGALIGGGIGALIGFFLAPVTFGASVPLFAAIGAVVGGAAVGAGVGAGIGAIVDSCCRNAGASDEIAYQAVPTEDPDQEGFNNTTMHARLGASASERKKKGLLMKDTYDDPREEYASRNVTYSAPRDFAHNGMNVSRNTYNS